MPTDPEPTTPIAPYGWTIRDNTWQQNYGHFGRHVDAVAVREAIVGWFASRGTTGVIRPEDVAVVELPAGTSPLPLNPQWFERAELAPRPGQHYERYAGLTRPPGWPGDPQTSHAVVCACGDLFTGPSSMAASSALTEHAQRARDEL